MSTTQVMLLCLAASLMIGVGVLYRGLDRLDKTAERVLSEKYRSIYRVLSVPTDTRVICKPDGASIEVGDFGWEAEPIRKDGLTYLHGLTGEWFVAWHAGFTAEQIELVGPKPRSQYGLLRAWPDFSSAPPCPFPIRDRRTTAMGLPKPERLWGYAKGE